MKVGKIYINRLATAWPMEEAKTLVDIVDKIAQWGMLGLAVTISTGFVAATSYFWHRYRVFEKSGLSSFNVRRRLQNWDPDRAYDVAKIALKLPPEARDDFFERMMKYMKAEKPRIWAPETGIILVPGDMPEQGKLYVP